MLVAGAGYPGIAMPFASRRRDRRSAEDSWAELARDKNLPPDSANRDFRQAAKCEIGRAVPELFARPTFRRCRLRCAKAPASRRRRHARRHERYIAIHISVIGRDRVPRVKDSRNDDKNDDDCPEDNQRGAHLAFSSCENSRQFRLRCDRRGLIRRGGS